MNLITWLEDWYTSNCDGDWEHQYGISIETLDNPGWHLKLNLTYTLYDDVAFEEIKIERTEHDWVWCRKFDGNIDCMGGPKNFGEMLGIVKKWMDDNKPDMAVISEHFREIMECREFRGMELPEPKIPS